MLQRPQIAFLHGVVGIGGVPQQIAGERIDLVEMRQRRIPKAPRPLRIVHITGHGAAYPARTATPRKHHCEAPLPAVPSTTMVPTMCGCKEQK